MRIFMAVLLILITVFVAACSSNDESNQTATLSETHTGDAVYQTISIDELADIMNEDDKTYTVINVHIPYQGEIEGTDATIAFNDIGALTAAFPDKNTPIILYCRSGNMSEQATRELVELGYTQVYDVPGGMVAWESSGRAIVIDNQ